MLTPVIYVTLKVPKVNVHVVVPLEETLKKFQGPSNLMKKRHAKLIDYENAKRKLERLKESQRTQSVVVCPPDVQTDK